MVYDNLHILSKNFILHNGISKIIYFIEPKFSFTQKWIWINLGKTCKRSDGWIKIYSTSVSQKLNIAYLLYTYIYGYESINDVRNSF